MHTQDTAHHTAHRSLPEIERLIDGSALVPAGNQRAKALFRRLAEAEATIHGTPLDKVHLHEVGALDSIIDIVGTVYALDAIGNRGASPLRRSTSAAEPFRRRTGCIRSRRPRRHAC